MYTLTFAPASGSCDLVHYDSTVNIASDVLMESAPGSSPPKSVNVTIPPTAYPVKVGETKVAGKGQAATLDWEIGSSTGLSLKSSFFSEGTTSATHEVVLDSNNQWSGVFTIAADKRQQNYNLEIYVEDRPDIQAEAELWVDGERHSSLSRGVWQDFDLNATTISIMARLLSNSQGALKFSGNTRPLLRKLKL